MNNGKSSNETLFSMDFNPLKKESLFQKNNTSSKKGEAISATKTKAVLVYFIFFTKHKLNTANRMINSVHGFLKIRVTAIKIRKPLNNLLKFFSEMFIV